MDKSRDWQTRLTHEGSLHERSSFVTLTYSDEHLPPDYSVNVRDMQLFMKRLRKQSTEKIRFFACGEYGDTTLRPHYHVLLFGQDFPDRKLWRKTASGKYSYVSEALVRLWPFGNSELSDFTPASAGYVARYCLKKVNGDMAKEHYTRINPLSGEVVTVRPEFICMSRRPGIGSEWFDKYSMDAFPSDFVVLDGRKAPIPDFYTRKLAEQELLAVKAKRRDQAKANADNNTPERLETREEVQRLRLVNLKREL